MRYDRGTQFFEVVYREWKNKKIFIVEKASFYTVDTLKHGEANEYDQAGNPDGNSRIYNFVAGYPLN